jgi:transposase-like protein
VDGTSRAERVATARRLRAQGLIKREIAARMGVARSTVDSWLNDPDGSRLRARKASYSVPCVDCGAPTDGSGGRKVTRTRCSTCWTRYRHENRVWTQEAIVIAVREFARLYGTPPAATDWNVGAANDLQRERFYEDDCWPHSSVVTREFGTWNIAIRAAGFEPNHIGHYGRDGENAALCQEIRERYEDGESAARLAREFGCRPDTIRARAARARSRAA